jgi:hypothetical protein
MWVCSIEECREYIGYPSSGGFYGDAYIHHDESVREIDNVRCSECDTEATWCEYCDGQSYCEEHSMDARGELLPSSFSHNVNWVTKKTAA